ncbi:hypothetical protein ACFYMX_08635 [Streptomyces griseofuscus]|uniref:hypothetical protein n=1 Tax=Streptomyces griseofuscus TaxID=146922 RepID=UPI0036C4FBCB
MTVNLPNLTDIERTGLEYAIAERVVATFVVTACGVGVAAGPADMFHASFWETMAAAGLAAAGSLIKGVLARPFGTKNSASFVRDTWCGARRPVSRRRAFLVVTGIGWSLYGGLGIVGQPRYGTARGLADVIKYVPLDALGWMWVALGFAALGVPAGLWAGAFAEGAATTYPSAVGSACGWGAFTVGVVLVSGMDDPLPPHLRKRGR